MSLWRGTWLNTETTLPLRFVAFSAIEYDEVFSGYQPGQLIARENFIKLCLYLFLSV
jgi:hypothetical protein